MFFCHQTLDPGQHAMLPCHSEILAALLQVATSPGPCHQGPAALRAPGLKQASLRRSLQCSASAADAAAASQAAPSSNGALSRIVDIELKAEAEQSYLAVRPLHLMPYTGAIASVKTALLCACPAPLICAWTASLAIPIGKNPWALCEAELLPVLCDRSMPCQ